MAVGREIRCVWRVRAMNNGFSIIYHTNTHMHVLLLKKKVSLKINQYPSQPKKARTFYTPRSHGPDGSWVNKLPTTSFVRNQTCQYKP
jgi:hypothetical protein